MKPQRAVWVTALASVVVCVLVAAACQGRSADPLADQDPKVKWEYKLFHLSARERMDEQKEFNKLGDEGWEFAGSFSTHRDFPDTVVLKKTKQK